jgi:hypothetical protein
MRCEVVDGVMTFLAHANVRQVSEAQVARSQHLARLRLLPGEAELPIRPDAFLAWQDFVEEVCAAEDLSLETACEVFEARFLRVVWYVRGETDSDDTGWFVYRLRTPGQDVQCTMCEADASA